MCTRAPVWVRPRAYVLRARGTRARVRVRVRVGRGEFDRAEMHQGILGHSIENREHWAEKPAHVQMGDRAHI